MTLILSVFIFSIVTILIIILLLWKTKELTFTDLQRLKGATICLISSGVLLILNESVTSNYNKASSFLSKHIEFETSELILYFLGITIFIAFFRAIKH